MDVLEKFNDLTYQWASIPLPAPHGHRIVDHTNCVGGSIFAGHSIVHVYVVGQNPEDGDVFFITSGLVSILRSTQQMKPLLAGFKIWAEINEDESQHTTEQPHTIDLWFYREFDARKFVRQALKGNVELALPCAGFVLTALLLETEG